MRASHRHSSRPGRPPQVGLFGLLGSGNLGNDASLDVVIDFLRTAQPEARLEAMCAGPAVVFARHGIPAVALHSLAEGAPRVFAVPAKIVAKVVDLVRILAFVRRCDVVIVPGMGVLETTLPLRPWGFPLALCTLAAGGRLSGTTVALVGVGASHIKARVTRWLMVTAARLAGHRSYRDQFSKDALARMGVDTAGDAVHPDLAFGLPDPVGIASTVPRSVGVGVMDYHGGNDDRAQSDDIHAAYLACMSGLVSWLLDDGRQVRLLIGDQVDRRVVDVVLADVARRQPPIEPGRVVAEQMHDIDDLVRQVASVDLVVASRYHNVLTALKLAKPTVALGYGVKNEVLMTGMGVGAHSQSLRSLDLDRLKAQVRAVDADRTMIEQTLRARSAANRRELDLMFSNLTTALFPAAPRGASATVTADREQPSRTR